MKLYHFRSGSLPTYTAAADMIEEADRRVRDYITTYDDASVWAARLVMISQCRANVVTPTQSDAMDPNTPRAVCYDIGMVIKCE